MFTRKKQFENLYDTFGGTATCAEFYNGLYCLAHKNGITDTNKIHEYVEGLAHWLAASVIPEWASIAECDMEPELVTRIHKELTTHNYSTRESMPEWTDDIDHNMSHNMFNDNDQLCSWLDERSSQAISNVVNNRASYKENEVLYMIGEKKDDYGKPMPPSFKPMMFDAVSMEIMQSMLALLLGMDDYDTIMMVDNGSWNDSSCCGAWLEELPANTMERRETLIELAQHENTMIAIIENYSSDPEEAKTIVENAAVSGMLEECSDIILIIASNTLESPREMSNMLNELENIGITRILFTVEASNRRAEIGTNEVFEQATSKAVYPLAMKQKKTSNHIRFYNWRWCCETIPIEKNDPKRFNKLRDAVHAIRLYNTLVGGEALDDDSRESVREIVEIMQSFGKKMTGRKLFDEDISNVQIPYDVHGAECFAEILDQANEKAYDRQLSEDCYSSLSSNHYKHTISPYRALEQAIVVLDLNEEARRTAYEYCDLTEYEAWSITNEIDNILERIQNEFIEQAGIEMFDALISGVPVEDLSFNA